MSIFSKQLDLLGGVSEGFLETWLFSWDRKDNSELGRPKVTDGTGEVCVKDLPEPRLKGKAQGKELEEAAT